MNKIVQTRKIKNLIRQSISANIRPRYTGSMKEWMADNIKLSDSPYGQRFVPDRFPWIIPIAEDYVNHKYETYVVFGAAQCGKSSLESGLLQYNIEENPGDILFVHTTDGSLGTFVDTKLRPSLELGGRMGKEKISKGGRNKKDLIQYDLCNVIIKAANRNSVSSWSIPFVFADEFAKYEEKESVIDEIINRTTQFYNRKLFFNSTPTTDTHRSNKLWMSGDQGKWAPRCPKCKEWFIMEWKPCIKWELDEHGKVKDVWCQCPNLDCNEKYHQTDVNLALLNKEGKYISTNPNPSDPTIKSYQFNGLLCEKIKWEKLVYEFLQANKNAVAGSSFDQLKNFRMNRLAQPWRTKDFDVEVKKEWPVLEIKKDDGHWQKYMRAMTIDVQDQAKYFYYVIREWDQFGNSFLVEAGMKTMFQELRKRQEHHGVIDKRVGVDCNHKPEIVAEHCSKYGWQMLEGTGSNYYIWRNPNTRRPYRRLIDNPVKDHLIRVNSPIRIRFSSQGLKSILLALRDKRLKVKWDYDKENVMLEDKEIYKKHIHSNEVRTKTDKDGNIKSRKIETLNSNIDEDFFDCETYQLVFAFIAQLKFSNDYITEDTDK